MRVYINMFAYGNIEVDAYLFYMADNLVAI